MHCQFLRSRPRAPVALDPSPSCRCALSLACAVLPLRLSLSPSCTLVSCLASSPVAFFPCRPLALFPVALSPSSLSPCRPPALLSSRPGTGMLAEFWVNALTRATDTAGKSSLWTHNTSQSPCSSRKIKHQKVGTFRDFVKPSAVTEGQQVGERNRMHRHSPIVERPFFRLLGRRDGRHALSRGQVDIECGRCSLDALAFPHVHVRLVV